MRLELGVAVRAEPQLRALPGLLQTVELVPLPQDLLEARVAREVAANPMLRRGRQPTCASCGSRRVEGRCPRCSGPAGRVPEPATNPFESLAVLARCEVDPADRDAVEVVVDHLTGRGLLDADPAQIAADHRLPLARVAAAIRAVRAVGPPGIARRTVGELLADQARRLVADGEAPAWIVDLVRDHLPAIAEGDARTPADRLGVPVDDVAAAFELVRSRLRPLAAHDSGPAPMRAPAADVLVYQDAAGLSVEVPDSRSFGLRVAPVPAAVRADPGAVAWLEVHRREAVALMRQIDARAAVLQHVAACAVERQADFLARGPAGHVRLTRTEVAAELGLHPSTVSRAVAGKTMRRPDGRVVPLEILFGSGVAIRDLVRRLSGDGPLSDAQLCSALASHGHVVARRTVAKYRAQLGIPAAGGRVRS